MIQVYNVIGFKVYLPWSGKKIWVVNNNSESFKMEWNDLSRVPTYVYLNYFARIVK